MPVGDNGTTQKARITVRIVENGYIVEYKQANNIIWEYVCDSPQDVYDKVALFITGDD